jgi:hypothetical protein
MAITPDQQATLQLLLERGQGYGDLAKLLGQDEAEVRARARAALTELGGADPDRNVGLTDYLLGQADPIGRADASRHLREDPADHRLAAELSETLRAMFPAAELPRLPGEPRAPRRRRAAGAEDATAPTSPLAGLSGSQTRVIAIAGGAAAVLVVVVLAIAGVFGGDDEGGPSDSATASETTTTAPADEQIQRVPLEAAGGGDARGEAVFGLATGDQPFVEVGIEGLDPAPNGDTYVIWLMINDTEGYPLSPITVGENGTFSNRFSIPSAVLSLVARVQFVDVSIAPVKTIRKLVREALQESALVLEEPGEVVLRGEIRAPADAGGNGGGGN